MVPFNQIDLSNGIATIRAIFDTLPIAAYLLDEEGKILHFNQVAVELWGRSPKLNDDEDRYSGAYRVYNLDGSEIHFKQGKGLTGGALRNGTHVSGREVIIERPDGSRIFCRTSVTPLTDVNGNSCGALVYGWDSTSEHLAERAMLADDAFFGTDRIGRYEYDVQTDRMLWSDTMLELHDLRRDEFQENGDFAFSFVHPDDRKKLLNETGKMDRSQVPLPVQVRIISRKNVERTLLYSFEVEWNSSGKPSRRIGTARDISPQVKWQKALQDSEDRFRQIVRTIEDVFWIFDVSRLEISYVSPAYTRVWGRQVKDLICNPVSFFETIHPEDRPQVMNLLIRQKDKCAKFAFQFRMIRGDGSIRCISSTAFPVRDGRDRCERYVGVARDITEREETRNQLNQSLQRMKLLAEASFEGMLIAEDHTIVDCNEQLAKMFGYSRDQLLGRNSAVILNIEDRIRLEQNVENHTDQHVECEGRRYDGSFIAFELRGRTMRVDGRLILIKVVRDITDRKTAEGQLKQLHSEIWRMDRIRTLGQLAAGLAHELNQPLGAILNYSTIAAEQARQNTAAPERMRSVFEKISLQATRAGSIISSLRALVRGRRAVRTSVDINSAVMETLNLMSFEFRQAKIIVQTHLDPASPTVIGDDVQIKQVLVNLISNAIHAMQAEHWKGKTLRLSSGVEQDLVRLDIMDQGVGMPGGRQVSLFEPFFSTKADGLGLGLSICQAILADLGGTLTSSQNPCSGGGTLMTIHFRRSKESR
jgi:two-component system sensor kinase FixL